MNMHLTRVCYCRFFLHHAILLVQVIYVTDRNHSVYENPSEYFKCVYTNDCGTSEVR